MRAASREKALVLQLDFVCACLCVCHVSCCVSVWCVCAYAVANSATNGFANGCVRQPVRGWWQMTTMRGQKMKSRTTTLQPQRRQLVYSRGVREEISHAASHRARMRSSHFFFLGAAGFLAAPLEAPPFAAPPAPGTTRAHTPIRHSRARQTASRRESMRLRLPFPHPC